MFFAVNGRSRRVRSDKWLFFWEGAIVVDNEARGTTRFKGMISAYDIARRYVVLARRIKIAEGSKRVIERGTNSSKRREGAGCVGDPKGDERQGGGRGGGIE